MSQGDRFISKIQLSQGRYAPTHVLGVQLVIVSTYHETMVGRAPDVQVLRHVAYPIEIDMPYTREEVAVLSSAAPYIVAVGTENITLSQPGNHAVGFIGDAPDHLGYNIFCPTHSVGGGTHIYHPYSNRVIDLDREMTARYDPDTTCVTWMPQQRLFGNGMPLRPYLAGEPCWIASMRYGGDTSFHLQITTRDATISGASAVDKYGTVCPVIDGDSEGIGPGRSGSAVIQRFTGEGYGFVGGLHGLSIDNRIMFYPIPQMLLSKYPKKHDWVTTIMVQ